MTSAEHPLRLDHSMNPERRAACWLTLVVVATVALPHLAMSAAAAATTTARATREVPPSIDATGKTDVTGAFNRFLAGVPDGSVVRFRPGGRYRVEGTLVLDHRHDIELQGSGATVFATSRGTRTRSHVLVRGGSRIVIRDLVVKGANPHAGLADAAYQPKLEAQHGFEIDGAKGVELDRVRATDVYGDFVYIGPTADRTWSDQIWVHDSSFARNGRQGVSVTAATNVVVERNVITDTRRATFDLEPTGRSWGARSVHILDNRIGPGHLLFLAAHGAGPVDEVVVAGNVLRGRDLTMDVLPPGPTRRRGFYVVGNRSDEGTSHTPLRFRRVDVLVVRDNRQVVSRAADAVSVVDGCSVVVQANDFGAGTRPLARVGRACGPAPRLDPPPPPPIPGRTAAQRSPSTTAAPTQHAPAPNRFPWDLAAGAAAVVLLGAGVTATVRRRRRRR